MREPKRQRAENLASGIPRRPASNALPLRMSHFLLLADVIEQANRQATLFSGSSRNCRHEQIRLTKPSAEPRNVKPG